MAEQAGSLPKSKAQKDAMSKFDQSGRPLGWLSDFVRSLVIQNQQGQTQTPGQQPMAKMAVPMPGGIPAMPNVPGFGVPVTPLNGMGGATLPQSGDAPQAPKAPSAPGQQGAEQGGSTHSGENVLSGLLKIIAMFGSGG